MMSLRLFSVEKQSELNETTHKPNERKYIEIHRKYSYRVYSAHAVVHGGVVRFMLTSTQHNTHGPCGPTNAFLLVLLGSTVRFGHLFSCESNACMFTDMMFVCTTEHIHWDTFNDWMLADIMCIFMFVSIRPSEGRFWSVCF